MKNQKFLYTPFKGLKESLLKKNFPLNHTDYKDKSDEEIFKEAMTDVREIKEFREISVNKVQKKFFIKIQNDNSIEILKEIISGKRKIQLSNTPEYVEWAHPNIRKDITYMLHNGYFSIQDTIDLHGLTLTQAEEALTKFIQNSIKRNLFCIKVIHGRGLRSPKGPVLKQAVINWLHKKFSKWLLAYATAKDCDGGLGATYIILKNK
jgi:DNA-nicking Smr family endonuclease